MGPMVLAINIKFPQDAVAVSGVFTQYLSYHIV